MTNRLRTSKYEPSHMSLLEWENLWKSLILQKFSRITRTTVKRPTFNTSRKKNILRIGHIDPIDGYLMDKEVKPTCATCETTITVKTLVKRMLRTSKQETRIKHFLSSPRTLRFSKRELNNLIGCLKKSKLLNFIERDKITSWIKRQQGGYGLWGWYKSSQEDRRGNASH